MRWICLAISVLVLQGALAQEVNLAVEEGTPEAQLLTRIHNETDPSRKVALCLEFEAKFPKNEAEIWVLDQLQTAYETLKQPDRAYEVAQQALRVDPDHLNAAYTCLRYAEAKRDPVLIQRWACLTGEIAKRVRKVDSPRDGEEPEQFAKRQEAAKSMEQYVEYALFRLIGQVATADKKQELTALLLQRYPQGRYTAELRRAADPRAASSPADAIARAERAIQEGTAQGDIYLMAADYYLQRSQEKALRYATRAVELANGPGPPEMDEAAWQRQRRQFLGKGHWMIGMIYSAQDNYAATDKALRAALPYLTGEDTLLASALLHLGYANARLADTTTDKTRVHDAIRYTEQCAAMKSSLQGAAAKSLAKIKAQYNMQ